MAKIDDLEQYYNAFIEVNDPKSFFIGLADYFDFIATTPEIAHVILEIVEKKQSFEKTLETLKLPALKKLGGIYKEILSYLTENKISNPIIDEATTNCNACMIKNRFKETCSPDWLSDEISDVIISLREMPEHKDFATRYNDLPLGKVKEVKDYVEAEKDFEEKQEVELWGQTLKVIKLYEAIKQGREIRRDLVKSMTEQRSSVAVFGLIFGSGAITSEWQRVRKDETGNPIYFKVEKVKPVVKRLQNHLRLKLENDEVAEIKAGHPGKKFPKSIHLIAKSVAAQDVIWLVFDELFDRPIMFPTKNANGEDASVKKLYDIAYPWDAPGRRVSYSKSVATNINSGLFRKRPVARYMKTNKLDKPTLVQKSEKGSFILKSDTVMVIGLLEHDVPTQFRHRYIEKTK